MPDPSDAELVAEARSGNQAAVSRLYDRYTLFVYRWVYARVGHRQEAEDITAECMTRMIEALPGLDETTRFRAWLFGMVRHVVADLWRGKYRLPVDQLPDELAKATPDPEPTDDDRLRQRAETIIQQLPENYRTVLEHRFFALRTVEETAAAMNLTIGNVKVLQHRALKKAAELANGV